MRERLLYIVYVIRVYFLKQYNIYMCVCFRCFTKIYMYKQLHIMMLNCRRGSHAHN